MVAVTRTTAGVAAAVAAARVLWRSWQRLRRRQWGGLESIVSFSSRVIAAARAIESMRPDALFVDPLAQLLAGPKAMARHQNYGVGEKSTVTAKDQNSNSSSSGPAATSQQQLQLQQQLQQHHDQEQAHDQQHELQEHAGREVSRIVLRTVFFDEATLLVTGQPAPRSRIVLLVVKTHIEQHGLKPCRQVVMLGAGMDTRPWRLPLDPQLSWFELDRSDVLAAKKAALTSAGAGFEPLPAPADGAEAAAAAADGATASAPAAESQLELSNNQTFSKSSSSSGKEGKEKAHSGSVNNTASSSSGDQGAVVVQHPLRVGRWVCASADLQKPGWVRALQQAGLQDTSPIVWSAEGLLYYLEPDSVGPMLKEAASISPPGSMIIANFITEEGLHLMTADRASNNNSHSKSNSNNTPQQQQQGAWPPSSGGGAGDAAAAAAAATTSSDSNGGSSSSNKKKKKQKPLQDDGLRKMGLLSQFKWGCPDNVEEFFESCGWQLLVRYSLSQATTAYGWNVVHTPASRVRTDSQEVQYVVGVVMK